LSDLEQHRTPDTIRQSERDTRIHEVADGVGSDPGVGVVPFRRQNESTSISTVAHDQLEAYAIDTLYHEIRKNGIKAAEPPGDTPWGTREMTVVDPDGNTLRFSNPVTP